MKETLFNKRGIDWLSVIKFHKEIVKISSEKFFSLPLNNNSSASWCFIDSFTSENITGPWTITLNQLQNETLKLRLIKGEFKELFIGMACIPKQYKDSINNNWSNFCCPLYLIEVKTELLEEETLVIELDKGKWIISPAFAQELNDLNISIEDDVEQFGIEIIEAAGKKVSAQKTDFPYSLKLEISERVPELKNKLFHDGKVFPANLDWVIFAPPDSISGFNQHLSKDYERLLKQVENTNTIGGLRLIEEYSKPKTIKPDSTESLPIVPLNKSQKKAVDGILGTEPITVISGPPGCGKSQVVVSVLLNAWAKGLSVLFASNNNQAVEVVKERMEQFDQEYRITLRAGSRQFSNLKDRLKTILQNINLKDGEAITKSVKEIEQRLTEKQELESFIKSKAPQQVEEAKNASLKAYSNFQKARLNLKSEEDALQVIISTTEFLYKSNDLHYSDFRDKVYFPIKNWIDQHSKYCNEAQVNETRRHETGLQQIIATEQIKEILLELGIPEPLPVNYKWPSPDASIYKWDEFIDKKLSDILQMDSSCFEMYNWEEQFAFWHSKEDTHQWISAIEQELPLMQEEIEALKIIDDKIAEFTVKLIEQKKILTELGINDPDRVDNILIRNWEILYSDLITKSNSITDWLPFSRKSKLLRKIDKTESHLKVMIPAKVWVGIGKLDDPGRKKLQEIFDQLNKFFEIYSSSILIQEQRNTLNKRFDKLCKIIQHQLRKRFKPIKDLNEANNSIGILVELLEISYRAAEVFAKKEIYLRSKESIKIISKELSTIFSQNRIFELWKKNTASLFFSLLQNISETPDPEKIESLKLWLGSSEFEAFSANIKVLRELYDKRAKLDILINSIENESTVFLKWYSKKPAILKFEKSAHKFPQEDNLLFSFPVTLEIICKTIDQKINNEISNLQIEVETELSHAKKSLQEALNIIPKTTDKNPVYKLILDYCKENSRIVWDTDIIARFFAESDYNPNKIKSKLATLDDLLKVKSLEYAYFKWLNRASSDDESQKSILAILNGYERNDSIEEKDYSHFKNSLRIANVWITTAQSTQAIPMIPDLFDILVIDEATQCTITNLLPLIYRAKRLVVIGDGNQLPSIPNIDRGTEIHLASNKFKIDTEILQIVGHNNNNVYKLGERCLARLADTIMLDEHYRCNPLIIGFSNSHIYQKKLKIQKNEKQEHLAPFSGVFGTNIRGYSKKEFPNSWSNEIEAGEIIRTIEKIKNNPETSYLSIGVITPFKKQEELLKKQLDAINLQENVTIGTVHQFQGGERDIIIFSPVCAEGMKDNSIHWIESPPNLINVVITRAKIAFIFIGDFERCKQRPKGSILKKLVEYVEIVNRLRKTPTETIGKSNEELELYSWMIIEGWDPRVRIPIAGIEVDFLLEMSGHKLIVEVDGDQHLFRQEEDKVRDAALRGAGCEVFRTSARDVREKPSVVIQSIKNYFK